jgi:phosphatidylinositol-3-phosphatase
MAPVTSAETASTAVDRCAECNARLTHDQRYCVECGTRRGPLPEHVAGVIGALREQGPGATLPPGTPLADSTRDGVAASPSPRWLQFALPGPRAAAAATIAMLGFGVVVGSLAGGTSVATLASAPLIVVGLAHTTPSAVTVQAAASDASGGGGGSAGSGGGGGGGGGGAAQASASPSTSPTSPSDTGTDTGTTTATGYNGLPPVKHVFLIVLSDRRITKSFDGGASAGYLGGALRAEGELVLNYYAVAGSPLANEIAMVSGQGPTAQTASDCPVFSRIKPGHKGARSQILGTGCVYPPATKTLAAQLTTAKDTWKAYFQGVNTSAATACKVPKTGSKEPQTAHSNTSYLAWRNPFVYFRSLTTGGACHSDEVGLGQLATDLKSASTTPSFSYIVPSPCDDGSEAPCKPHATPSLAGANKFLKTVVPEIKRSPAYKDDGMIAITFDQAPQTGPDADSTACCGPSSYPNLAKLTTPPAVPPAAMGVGTTSTSTTTTPGTDMTTTGADMTTTGTDTTTTGTDTTTTGTDTTTTGTDTTTTGTDTTTTGTDTTGTDTTTTGTDTTGTDTTTTGTTDTTPTGFGGGETTPTGGGGQVGLLLISQYVKPDSTDALDYFNHFSLLASIEKMFGLRTLGYAGVSGLPVFGVGAVSVFNNYTG